MASVPRWLCVHVVWCVCGTCLSEGVCVSLCMYRCVLHMCCVYTPTHKYRS